MSFQYSIVIKEDPDEMEFGKECDTNAMKTELNTAKQELHEVVPTVSSSNTGTNIKPDVENLHNSESNSSLGDDNDITIKEELIRVCNSVEMDSDDDNPDSQLPVEEGDEYLNNINGNRFKEVNVDFGDEFPPKIIENGKLVVKNAELESILKIFYGFNCELCDREKQNYTKIENVFDHYVSHHKVIGYVSCCSTKFTRRQTAILHMIRHLQPSELECPICKKTMTEFSRQSLHCPAHDPFTCDQCNKKLSTRSKLKRHKMIHLPVGERTPHTCNICNIRFKNEAAYYKHTSANHSVNKYFCPHCKSGFRQKFQLQAHVSTHSNLMNNKFVCEICSLAFKTTGTLKKHVKLHSSKVPKGINCQHCSFTCNTDGQRNSHIRRVHPDVKPHICMGCGKQFKMSSYLKKHIIRNACG